MTRIPQADAFFDRVETFLTRIANELGLGTAKGHFAHHQLGRNRTFTIFGTYLQLQLALVAEGPETMLSREQIRMRWYFWPLEAIQDIGKLPGRAPIMEITDGIDGFEKRCRRILGWIHDAGGSAVDVFRTLGESSLCRVKSDEAKADPDNELPTEGLPDDTLPS